MNRGLCGGFVWARRALNSPKRWFAARTDNLKQPDFANGSKQTSCPGVVNITEVVLRAWWDPGNSMGATRPFHGPWPYGIYPWGSWSRGPWSHSDAASYIFHGESRMKYAERPVWMTRRTARGQATGSRTSSPAARSPSSTCSGTRSGPPGALKRP